MQSQGLNMKLHLLTDWDCKSISRDILGISLAIPPIWYLVTNGLPHDELIQLLSILELST